MSEMVERVARALFEHSRADAQIGHFLYGEPPVPWGGIASRHQDSFREQARIAIAAMREPTKKMMNAAWHSASDEDCDDHWRAMIDAALSAEQPSVEGG